MTKFKNKYRIESTRLPGWNYSQGSYFITICTYKRYPYWGFVEHEQMFLSRAGQLVVDEWLQTPNIRPYVVLDEWTIMPDHFHAILHLRPDNITSRHNVADNQAWCSGVLGTIINQFKRKCTISIRTEVCEDFAWQARFHDRVIQNKDVLHKVRQYIHRHPTVCGRQ